MGPKSTSSSFFWLLYRVLFGFFFVPPVLLLINPIQGRLHSRPVYFLFFHLAIQLIIVRGGSRCLIKVDMENQVQVVRIFFTLSSVIVVIRFYFVSFRSYRGVCHHWYLCSFHWWLHQFSERFPSFPSSGFIVVGFCTWFFLLTFGSLFLKNLIQGGRIMVHQIIDVSTAALSFGTPKEPMVLVVCAEYRPRPTLSVAKMEKFVYHRLERFTVFWKNFATLMVVHAVRSSCVR